MDAEAARQQGQPGRRLTAAEHDRIGCGRIADQTVGMQLAVGRRMALHGGKIFVRDAHHAGSHRAAPARRRCRRRRDAGISYRLFGRAEREAM